MKAEVVIKLNIGKSLPKRQPESNSTEAHIARQCDEQSHGEKRADALIHVGETGEDLNPSSYLKSCLGCQTGNALSRCLLGPVVYRTFEDALANSPPLWVAGPTPKGDDSSNWWGSKGS